VNIDEYEQITKSVIKLVNIQSACVHSVTRLQVSCSILSKFLAQVNLYKFLARVSPALFDYSMVMC